MGEYAVRRIFLAVLVIFGVSSVVFIILRLSGDPVTLMLPEGATREDYFRVQRIMGLDKPILLQYLIFLERVAQGDFGVSFRYRESAMAVVLERLPATAELALATLAIVVVVAIPIGVLSAVRRGSTFDYFIATVTLSGQSMPNYWFGIMLILFFAVELRILPTSGYGSLRNLILPAITLASQPASRSARFIRSEMLEILAMDYIRTATAKGLARARILIGHGLRNAAIPLITLLGLDIGYLLGGAVVTETVFGWPGVGRLLIDAVNQRDFPVVQATVVFIALTVVVVNLVIDFCYLLLDPRIRLT